MPASFAMSSRWFFIVPALTALVMAIFILRFSGPEFVHDELNHVPNIEVFHRSDSLAIFLGDMNHSPGPLYTWLHALFEPLSELKPIRMRSLNFLLLISMVLVFFRTLSSLRQPNAFALSLTLFCFPGIVLTGALAITEIPALLFAMAAILFLTIGYQRGEIGDRAQILWGIGIGLLFALACLGRQTTLIILFSAIVLLRHKSKRPMLLTALFTGAVFPLSLFIVWSGTVPPHVQGIYQKALSLENLCILSGYLAITALLLYPQWVLFKNKKIYLLAAVFVLTNLIVPFMDWMPAYTLASRLFGPEVLSFSTRIFSSALVGLSALFLFHLFSELRNRFSDSLELFYITALTLSLLSTGLMTASLSSRYIIPAIPFLILIYRDRIKLNVWTALRLALGSLVGFFSLATYMGLI